jgi:membrane protein implicated in regulation of membrane protease activity
MNIRLLLAIFHTLIEGAILIVVMLFGLPRLGITIPLPLIIVLIAGWAIASIIIYRLVSRALGRKPAVGAEAISGSSGRVVKPLDPEGLIKVSGELWRARSSAGRRDTGKEVIVVRQEGTLLIVRAK